MGPLHYPQPTQPGQGLLHPCRRPHGCRRCLLKGCERWFRPSRPQARYCSETCRKAARAWCCWRAAQRYRATDKGKQQRRQQSQRYRQRRRQQRAASQAPPREGQRPDRIPEKTQGCPCDRPGCYQRFVRSRRSIEQRFCSAPCRQALRRVRQRECRRQERRRPGDRPRRVRPRAPPAADL